MSRSGVLTFTYWNILRIFYTCGEGFLNWFQYDTFDLGTSSSNRGWDDKGCDEDWYGEAEESNDDVTFETIRVGLAVIAMYIIVYLLIRSERVYDIYWYPCDWIDWDCYNWSCKRLARKGARHLLTQMCG